MSLDTVLYFNCFCVNQPKSICKQNDLISLSFYFDLKKWTFHKWIIIQNYDHALFYKRDSAWITWFSIIYFKQNQLNWVKLDFTMMKIPQKRCIPSFLKIQFFSYNWTQYRFSQTDLDVLVRILVFCPLLANSSRIFRNFNFPETNFWKTHPSKFYEYLHSVFVKYRV